jgi:hypothetical protein
LISGELRDVHSAEPLVFPVLEKPEELEGIKLGLEMSQSREFLAAGWIEVAPAISQVIYDVPDRATLLDTGCWLQLWT